MTRGVGGLASLLDLRRREEEAVARDLAVELAAGGALRASLAQALAERPPATGGALAGTSRAIARLCAGQEQAMARVEAARERLAAAAGRRRAVELTLERLRAERARLVERRSEAEVDDRHPHAHRRGGG